MVFSDDFNVNFSDDDASSSAKVVNPNVFQNIQTKTEQVMIYVHLYYNDLGSMRKVNNNSRQNFNMYFTGQN